jgi:hypothetical protein
MAEPQPLWLKVVTRLERVIGEQVEKVVRSDTYFDLVAESTRNQRRIADSVERVTTRCLHLFNMPASTDIRQVREQLNRMERRLTEVAKDVQDLRAETQDLPRTHAG